MSRHGDPDTEVEIVEDYEENAQGRQSVLRVPKIPTQAEVDAHLATHLPHADWCELCMKGRGRNTPHRRKKKRKENEGTDSSDDRAAPSSSLDPQVPALQFIPRTSMDYQERRKRGI